MHRVSQVLVATTADVDFVDLAGLVVDRRGPSHALEALRVFIERPVAADLAEQARCELGAGSGQRAEHAAVWMAGKEGFDAFAIRIELELEDAQLLATCHGEEAFSGGKGRAGMPLCSLLEGVDTLLIGLGAVEFVAVEEFFPFALAGFGECFW